MKLAISASVEGGEQVGAEAGAGGVAAAIKSPRAQWEIDTADWGLYHRIYG